MNNNQNLIFEQDVLPNIAADNEMLSFKHHGFWHAMDTLRDKTHLEDLWARGEVPWKVW